MSKLTAEVIAMEMDKFEALHPVPKYTSRCGNGYAVSEFNAWDGQSYCHMWKGWISRAEMALPVMEQQETLHVPAYYIVYHPNPAPNENDDKEHSHCGSIHLASRLAGEIGGTISPVYIGEKMTEGDIFKAVERRRGIPSTPQIDNDGWIEWGGGKCPIDDHDDVEVKFRDGVIEDGLACHFIWGEHDGIDAEGDIIAYRVIENDGREG